jgi:hypothetical protein
MTTCYASLDRLKFFDPTAKCSTQDFTECILRHITESIGYPFCPFAKCDEIWAREARNEGLGKLSRAVINTLGSRLASDKTATNHQKESSLDKSSSYEKFRGSHRQFRMKALRAVNITRMDNKVIEGDQTLKVKCARVRSDEDAQ